MKRNLQDVLIKHLGNTLYRHSQGVAQTAASLARLYGEQPERAYLAGMVHDYGKIYSGEELRHRAREMNLELDRVVLTEPGLLHAPVGAILLSRELGITDTEIIRAVTYHTTCRQGASLLERIIYLADYIEPGRRYPSVKNVREAAENSLNTALLLAVDQTIKRVLDRGKLLHPRSVEFRNSLLLSKI